MQINIQDEVESFIESLEKHTIAKILRTIDLLEKFGSQLSMPHSKKMTTGIFELRIRGQQEIRIFYCFHRNTAYLLHGYFKKSQKTPRKELSIAENRYKRLTSV